MSLHRDLSEADQFLTAEFNWFIEGAERLKNIR
jgi:hypothetical protein